MITIKDMIVSYGNTEVLRIDQELTFEKNDRIGVLGSNGAGKTTMIKACLGLIPFKGSVESTIKQREMSVHMQHNEYVETLKVRDIMETILNTKIKNNSKLNELINFFDFENSLNKKYKQLSGGQQQRFTLILVLMQDSPITFFDEVTTGLDFETRQALMKKINEWYHQKDATIFLVTHYFEELEQLTNKLLILDQGHVIDYDYRQQLFDKYCGYSVITMARNKISEKVAQEFKEIAAPKQTIAIACKDAFEELKLLNILHVNNLNFKRSDNDIEIMYLNALKENRHDALL